MIFATTAAGAPLGNRTADPGDRDIRQEGEL